MPILPIPIQVSAHPYLLSCLSQGSFVGGAMQLKICSFIRGFGVRAEYFFVGMLSKLTSAVKSEILEVIKCGQEI